MGQGCLGGMLFGTVVGIVESPSPAMYGGNGGLPCVLHRARSACFFGVEWSVCFYLEVRWLVCVVDREGGGEGERVSGGMSGRAKQLLTAPHSLIQLSNFPRLWPVLACCVCGGMLCGEFLRYCHGNHTKH